MWFPNIQNFICFYHLTYWRVKGYLFVYILNFFMVQQYWNPYIHLEPSQTLYSHHEKRVYCSTPSPTPLISSVLGEPHYRNNSTPLLLYSYNFTHLWSIYSPGNRKKFNDSATIRDINPNIAPKTNFTQPQVMMLSSPIAQFGAEILTDW